MKMNFCHRDIPGASLNGRLPAYETYRPRFDATREALSIACIVTHSCIIRVYKLCDQTTDVSGYGPVWGRQILSWPPLTNWSQHATVPSQTGLTSLFLQLATLGLHVPAYVYALPVTRV